MIKFFRKIRRNLLTEGKTIKYLKYAIGEIILVVIGILIALQINNWNENTKSLNKEQQILKDLKSELVSNIENLETSIEINKTSLKNAQFLAHFFQSLEEIANFPEDSLSQLGWDLPGDLFRPEKGIINSIINSGEIAIIRNDQLKYKLSSMIDRGESKMEPTYSLVELGQDYFNTKIYPQLFEKDNKGIVHLKSDSAKIIYGIPEYWLVIHGTYIGTREIAIKHQEELLDIYKDILKLINQEIRTD